MFQRTRRKLIVPFLLPQTILYVVFMFLPLVMTVAWAFTDWKGHGAQRQFNGLYNFSVVAKDHLFRNAIKHSFHWVIVGDENAPKARPPAAGARDGVLDRVQGLGIPCFVKQIQCGRGRVSKDPRDWRPAYRVQEYPRVLRAWADRQGIGMVPR